MTRDELQDLLAQSALGELSPDEEKTLRAYLETASDEEKQLAAAHAAVGAALDATVQKAPRRVYEAIDREIARDEAANAKPRNTGWIVAAAVAAVAGLVLYFVNDGHQADVQAAVARGKAEAQSTVMANVQQRELAEKETQRCQAEKVALEARARMIREVAALIEHKGTRMVALTPPSGGNERATAIVGPDGKRVLVFARDGKAPEGHTHQLWIIRGKDAPIAAGFLQSAVDDASYGEIDPKVLEGGMPDAFAISLEPQGGSATPTKVILVGKTS